MELLDLLITLGILLGLGIIIYAKVKNKTLKEIWEEISELIKPTGNFEQ